MARPTILGTVIRRIRLQHWSESSHKDYLITVSVEDSGTHHVYGEYGPAGRLQNGREVQLNNPTSAAEALRLSETIKKSKETQRQAYRVSSDQTFLPPTPLEHPVANKPVPEPKKGKLKSLDNLSADVRAQISSIF